MNPRRLTLHASIDQFAQDFIGAVLRALCSASVKEIGELQSSTVIRTVEAPAPPAPTDVVTPPRPPTALARLSARERDIFQRVLHGASSAGIARDLGVSLKTVQTHRAKVNKKLDVRSSAGLVRFGATHGLLLATHDAGAGAVRELPDNAGTGDVRELPDAPSPVFHLAEVERRTIAAALRAADGNRTRAAILLGIPRSSLYNKMGGASPRPARRRPAPPEASPHREEPDDVDPSVAITAPDAVLGLLEPSAKRARGRPAAPPAPERIAFPPATRPGEDVLRAAGGGAVLRRRRSQPTPPAAE